ncbi:hypothetical protein [Nocardia sp. NPDC059228]|uniref:hypothetical protein n=1 Tax=Nocardia sp. NPDC059228 TaxID=3346777 RepID=UPI0036A10BAD
MTINPPPHIARPSTDLVGPMVWFRGQPVAVTSSPPRDTTDPRYNACTEHRLACDCREAELSEGLAEHRIDRFALREQLEVALIDHPTVVLVDGIDRADLHCRCQGCEFARSISLVPFKNTRYLRSLL